VLVTLLLGAAATALGGLGVFALPRLLGPVEVPMQNGGFESGGASATAAGWTDHSTDGGQGAAFTEAGGLTGAHRLSHWSQAAYRVETYQFLPRLENGSYTLHVWTRSSGGQDEAYVALRNCGAAAEPRAPLPVSDSWQRVSITAQVTAGRCTISLVSHGRPGTWANFDDVRLLRSAGPRDAQQVPAVAVLGVLSVTVACALVGGSLIFRRRSLQPVAALTRAVRRLGAGHRWELLEVHGDDNVAELTETFNSMAAALMRDEERQRRLVADVAHELRTPLSTVRSYLEALIDGVLPAAPEVFVSLHDEALLQQRIIDDLQDLALADAGALTYRTAPVHLPELLRTCRNALAVKADGAGVRLSVQTIESGATTVLGDADRLRQVVGNLVGNALRYTPPGGSVTLRCGVSGDEAVVTVADTGSGIAAEHLPHVFDRFWRAEKSRGGGGSGLGLAIARRIVLDHGGDISVRSREGHGTTFVLRLPLAAAGDHPGTPAASARSGR
jgi:signal transduction histidine kinase